MRTLLFAVAIVLMLVSAPVANATGTTCTGRFINPVTDICWSCLLPLSLGSMTIANLGGQEDNGDNPSSPLCSCGTNPTIGLSLGFWEPARMVEVVRRPYCLVSLGGIEIDPGLYAPASGRTTSLNEQGESSSFYQAHFYIDPLLYWMGVVADFPCLEQGDMDLVYMTELDPLWADDELSLLLSPEVALFANPVAVAACAADCIAATTGFGSNNLFWCAGCQGALYPMQGRTGYHTGGVRTAELLMQRLTAKMHRELIAWGWHGQRGQCGPFFEPVMDKRAYKAQMTFPRASTGGGGVSCNGGDELISATGQCKRSDGSFYLPSPMLGEGRCCQPFGRTTALWGMGREVPVRGEDFSFMLFRKRNCCVGF
ncbi:MAG TPA: TraU family protein [Burkholderiaceae bacterium]|nr:TraU family protein [Burkholderiaceae bacterium]